MARSLAWRALLALALHSLLRLHAVRAISALLFSIALRLALSALLIRALHPRSLQACILVRILILCRVFW